MTQQLKSAGLALAILVLGLGLIVAVTEYEAGADAAGPRLMTTNDVIQALEDQGIVIAPDTQPAHHPLLGIAGTAFSIGASSVEVYTYRDVATRVADEQIIQRYILQLQALEPGADAPFRITSARNVLLLFHAETSELAAAIHAAARALSAGAVS